MKKITSFIITALCFTQFSCKDDFLTTTDPTRINSNLFYQNQTQFEQALNGVYGQLQGITNTAYLGQEFMSDNTTLDLYRTLAIADETRDPAFDTSLLHPNEMDAFSTLSAGRMRLEQERIPMDYVRDEIERIMGSTKGSFI